MLQIAYALTSSLSCILFKQGISRNQRFLVLNHKHVFQHIIAKKYCESHKNGSPEILMVIIKISILASLQQN